MDQPILVYLWLRERLRAAWQALTDNERQQLRALGAAPDPASAERDRDTGRRSPDED